MDAEDPPLYLTYPADMTLPAATPTAAIHHGMFGIKLKEKADKMGYKIRLNIPGTINAEFYSNAEMFLEMILLKGNSAATLKTKP